MEEGTGWGFRLASAKARLSRLPAARWPACHSRGEPSRSSGPPSPCTRNSYPPQSLTGALGPRLEEGERKHIFITVIEPDTFAAGRPRSRGPPPSGFLLSCCVFWMARPGVCCVNVHGNVMHLPHSGAVSSSPWAHPPPHLQHCWGTCGLPAPERRPAWTMFLSSPTASWLLGNGTSKEEHLLSSLRRLHSVSHLAARCQGEGRQRMQNNTTSQREFEDYALSS